MAKVYFYKQGEGIYPRYSINAIEIHIDFSTEIIIFTKTLNHKEVGIRFSALGRSPHTHIPISFNSAHREFHIVITQEAWETVLGILEPEEK